MIEFWNSEVTAASWEGLKSIRQEIDFVLIGGWAVYLYSNLQKSKDIDIIVDYDTLSVLASKHTIVKNDRLKKYEIKFEKYDIDIYLPNYSPLPIPPRDILLEYSIKHQGFTLPAQEVLLTLKLGAANDRRFSTKGDKDSIDILGILFYSGIEIQKLGKVLSRYNLNGFSSLLISILTDFSKSNLAFLNLNEYKFSKLKKEYLNQLEDLK